MTINLTTTSHKLRLTTTTTVATSVVASGRDKTTSAETPISQETAIVTATTTDIVSAPAASTQRQMDDVEICVTGSGSQGITVFKDVSGTPFTMLSILLGTNERAHFTDDMGWRVFDGFGREKGDDVGYSLIKAPTLLTSGSAFTPSVNCTALLIELWAGGGAGGGAPVNAASNASCGTGGNAGGKLRKFLQGIPNSIPFSIGTGGTGVSGAAGNPGGNTTVGPVNGVTYTATGGPGGQILATGLTVAEVSSSAAVSGTNGDENNLGSRGEIGVRGGTGATIQACGGRGGDADMGAPGLGRSSTNTGQAASGFNAGGGGAASQSAGAVQTGGAGAPGCIRVWEFTG